MKWYIGIIAFSLFPAFGFNMINVSTASAIGFLDPVELLTEQEAEAATFSNFSEQVTGQKYRVLEPVVIEEEFNVEEAANQVDAGF